MDGNTTHILALLMNAHQEIGRLREKLHTSFDEQARRPAQTQSTATGNLVLDALGWQFVNPNRIGAIKVVRAATGLGLKESKDLMEDWVERERPHNPPR